MRRSARAPVTMSKRHILYALFIGLNVCWFVWTLVFVGGAEPEQHTGGENLNLKDKRGSASEGNPPMQSYGNPTDEFPFGEPLSVRTARAKVSGNVLSSMSGKLLVSANGVGIGTSTMDAADKLVVNGPIRISDGGTRPSCSASHRGMLWHEFGELGVGDSVDACVKNKYDDYEWRSVVRGGGGGGGGAGAGLTSGQSGFARSKEATFSDADGLIRTFLVGAGEGVGNGDVVSFVEGKAQRGFGLHFGKPVVFIDAGAESGQGHKRRLHTLSLSSTRMVVMYGGGNASPSMAQMASLHGANDLQVDRVRVDFGPKRLDHFSTAALTSSKFLVVFADPTAKDVGTVVIGRVDSDDALHFSQEHRFLLGTGVTGVAVCALSPTRFAIAFNVRSQGSGHGAPYVMIGMLAPQDEDAEKEEEESLIFSNATEVGVHLDGLTLVQLSVDRFAMVYRNLRTKAAGVRTAAVVNPSAENLDQFQVVFAAETAVQTPGRLLTYLQVAKLSSTRIVVVYADSQEGHAVVVDISGGVLTAGIPTRFSAGKALSVSVAPLDATKVIIGFYTSSPWRAVVVKAELGGIGAGGALSGSLNSEDTNSLTFSDHTLSEHYSTHTTLSAFDGNRFVVGFYDGGADDAGSLVAGSLGTGIGVATGSATEGEQVPVLFAGVSQGHRALAVGSCYYSRADGTVTTARTTHKVGLAISPTEILVGSQGC